MRALRLASLTTLGLAGLAAAATPATADSNAPGSCACEVAPPAAATGGQGWDGRKWGIGLRATSIAIHPENNPDAESEYAGGGLQLRWRLSPRWELEGTSEGLREQLGDGVEGDRQLHAATLAARYHLRPYGRWDWYALVGIGGTMEMIDDGDQPVALSRAGHVHLGGGVERRFGRFGIAAELRAIGMGPSETIDERPPEAVPTDPRMPMGTVPTQEIEEPGGSSGGQLTLAATYYF
jgi:hypothetical protein